MIHPRWRQETFGVWLPTKTPDGSWIVVMHRMRKEPAVYVRGSDALENYRMDEDEALHLARLLNASNFAPHCLGDGT